MPTDERTERERLDVHERAKHDAAMRERFYCFACTAWDRCKGAHHIPHRASEKEIREAAALLTERTGEREPRCFCRKGSPPKMDPAPQPERGEGAPDPASPVYLSIESERRIGDPCPGCGQGMELR